MITSVSVKCDNLQDAIVNLIKIEKYAHKDNLLDAISDKSLEEIEQDLDDEVCRIGFKA
jgi:hypothetical protein